MSQKLIEFICEQCGRTDFKKPYYIDNIIICTNCYRQLRYYDCPDNNASNIVYKIPILREIRMKETKEMAIPRKKLYGHEWNKNNREKANSYRRANRALWPNPTSMSNNDPKVIMSEKYTVEEILPKLGFVDILWCRKYHSRFFCDILAKDSDGRECGFDVKLGIVYDYLPKKAVFVDHLGLRYFIVHVKADLSFYHMNEMSTNKRYSSAVNAYRKFLSTIEQSYR